jgi:serine/threonine protein kinase
LFDIMSLPAGTRLGAYEILALIGAGGMGEVCRARNTKLGRDVAMKVLPETFAHDRDRLDDLSVRRSCWRYRTISNIAAIYGLEESGRAIFFVGQGEQEREARSV